MTGEEILGYFGLIVIILMLVLVCIMAYYEL